jgi:hypothetical protein
MPFYPTLFIGLGGTGVKTLAYLKRILQRSVPEEERRTFYRFRLFDTDHTEWDFLEKEFDAEFKLDPDFIHREFEWCSIGNFNPQAWWQEIKRDPQNPVHSDILRWIDPREAEGFPSRMVTVGADARRQLGRLCLAHHFETVKTTIRRDITQLNAVRAEGNVQRQIQIIIVTGSCGGTGSSVFYDILYLINLIYHDLAHADPLLRPVIFAPKPFIRAAEADRRGAELIARYQANGYAFLAELQHAFELNSRGGYTGAGDFVLPTSGDVANFDQNWTPFGGAMIVDPQREGALSFLQFSDNRFYSTVAELLFHISLSGSDARMDAVWTNANPRIASTADRTFPRYLTAGFRALEYPSDALKNYVSLRFTANLLCGRLSAADGAGYSEGELRTQAETFLQSVILPPLRGIETAENSFESYVERQYLSQPGCALDRLRTDAQFYLIDSSSPSAEPKVDVDAVTSQRLDDAITECRQEIDSVKRAIRGDFSKRFGDPSVKIADGVYSRILDQMYALMEETIEKCGVRSWAGTVGSPGTGLVQHLVFAIRERRGQAITGLTNSNANVQRGFGNAEGLEWLKEDALDTARQARETLLGRGKKMAELKKALEQFAAKRAELLQEAVHNLILMLEVEYLTFVGFDAEQTEVLEYFTSQPTRHQSLLYRLKQQGGRIRSWLETAATKQQALLENLAHSIHSAAASDLTSYHPAIDQITDLAGSPGPLADQVLTRLQDLLVSVPRLLRTFANSDWRGVQATSNESSEHVANAFAAGCAKWVVRQLDTEAELKVHSTRSLEDYLRDNPSLQNELAVLLSNANVAVFSPVSDACRNTRPCFRLLVTGSSPDKGSLADMLGYQPGTHQTHMVDPDARHRALSVKLYHGLYLNDDFPWVRELKGFYDRLIDYNPHIWWDGRIRISVGGTVRRWKIAFADVFLWALRFQGDKWKSDDALRGLFTKKLEHEPNAYLHEPPLTLRAKTPYVLDQALEDSMIQTDGRLELRVTDKDFQRVGNPGDYGRAWAEFLKRPKALKNAEFFMEWCSGIKVFWADDSDSPVVAITNQERARVFLAAVPEFISTAVARKKQIENMARRSEQDSAASEVLGWVANELEDQSVLVRESLGEATL